MKTHQIGLLLFFVLCASCSNKEIYTAIQDAQYNPQHCMTLPKSEYEECINHQQKSYEQYKREREATTQSK